MSINDIQYMDMSCADRANSVLFCKTFTNLMSSNLTHFVAGDFNHPNVNWNLLIAPDDGVHNIFLNLFVDNDLRQVIRSPTRLNNILDIFLTNILTLVFDWALNDKLGSSDHHTIVLNICIPLSKRESSSEPFL